MIDCLGCQWIYTFKWTCQRTEVNIDDDDDDDVKPDDGLQGKEGGLRGGKRVERVSEWWWDDEAFSG